MPTIRVLLFASLKEQLGWEEKTLPFTPGLRIKDLKNQLLPNQLNHPCLFACNLNFVESSHLISPGDEIALIPPVSGG